MDSAHRASQPSHISMILRQDADVSLLKKIKDIPGVDDVDTLTPLSVRYRLLDKSEWQTGTLILRPPTAKQKYDITTLSSGDWPTDEHIAIERLSAQYTHQKVSDSVAFATENGKKQLPISGVVRHPFINPPSFGGQIHFFADYALAERFGVEKDTFRQLLVQVKPPYSLEKARAVAKAIRTFLSDHDTGVNVTVLQDPEKHWGRPIFEGINNVLKLMALAALALACVLIFNTVSAHIAQQTNQIGIMKSLGGGGWTIAKIYLIETFIIAVIAVIWAVPSGLISAYLSSCNLLGLFNIECKAFTYSPKAVDYMVLGGLIAPLAAALVPIWRGATMNVREAIASYGLGGDFGTSWFDLWVERFGALFLSTLGAAALGNLFRRKGRLLLTQGVLIIAGVTFLVLMSLIASVNFTMDNEMARSKYSVRLGFSRDQPGKKVTELAEVVPGTEQVELWQRHLVEITKNNNTLRQKGSLGVQLLALPATTAMYQPLIVSGRWFNADDVGKRVLVLSAETAELSGIKVGDKVAVAIGAAKKRSWEVIGTYRWLAGNSLAVEPVYAPLETIQDLTLRKRQKKSASFALLTASVTTLAEEADYLRQLKQAFQDEAIPLDVYTTHAKLEQRQFTRNQLNPMIATLFGLAAMIAAVGGIGLSGTLAISVLQRIHEIGVLRAIGAPSAAIFRLFLLEGLLHGVIAWMVSIPLAYYVAEPIAKELGLTLFSIQLDYTFDVMAIAYWLAIVIVLALTASIWPARKASMLTVRECISG